MWSRIGHTAATIGSLALLACTGTSPVPPPPPPDLTPLAVRSLSVDTLRSGLQLTIRGEGFGRSMSELGVRVDGEAASVASVTPVEVVIEVPPLCRPTGMVEVAVLRAGATATLLAPFRSDDATDLPIGDLRLIGQRERHCLLLPDGGVEAEYLIGVLNAAESPVDARVISLVGRVAGSPPVAVVSAEPAEEPAVPAQRGWSGQRTDDPLGKGHDDRSARETRIRITDDALLRVRATRGLPRGRDVQGSRASARGSAALAITAAVNDTVTLNFAAGGCTVRATIRAVVRSRSRRSIWLEDLENPSGGLSRVQYDSLAERFDRQIYPADSSAWGAPTDLDGNERIGIVVSEEVNRVGLLGFATAADFLVPTGADGCARSNFGELLYVRAPDPLNQLGGGASDAAAALRDLPVLLAHELTHVIQFGRRLTAAQPPLELWEAEGQATLAEQLNGFAAEGLAADANAGLAVAYRDFDPARTAWFADLFTDLAQFQGMACRAEARDGSCVLAVRVPGAPEACSPLATFTFSSYGDMGAPCNGRRAAYGVPALLIGFAAEQYGSAAGGREAFLASLIASGSSGLANLSGRAGIPADRLLAEFYAALHLDDRGVADAPALRAWNLPDIFEGEVMGATGERRSLVPEARLEARRQDGRDFRLPLLVRGGSSAAVRLSIVPGGSGIGVGLRADDAGGIAPGLRLWVVRLR